MNGGYLTLLRVRGVPFRFHWTVPLGAFFLGAMRFDPPAWAGFVALILAHEIGHALVVRACGFRVLAVDVHGVGGLCRWSGSATPMQRAAIAWGGVWAQMVVLFAAMIVSWIHGPPVTRIGASLDEMFVDRNLLMIALNLLPVSPLDGAQAWALPRLLFRRFITAMQAPRFERETSWRKSDSSQRSESAIRKKQASPGHLSAVRDDDAANEADRLLGQIKGLRRPGDPPSETPVRAGRGKPN